MKILVLGSRGQVGWELCRTLSPLGEVVGLDAKDIDLSNLGLAREIVSSTNAQVVCNAVAYTAVDKAETDQSLSRRLNAELPGTLAEACRAQNALLVHYSTDYVYDGSGTHQWTEEAPTAPLSEYGRSKLAGDQAIVASGTEHLLFRLQWVYGNRGANFLKTMLRLAREREELKIVDDQIGAPTWSRQIAQATAFAVAQWRKQGQKGIYHLAASGETSWCGFARKIFELDPSKQEQVLKTLIPIATSAYPTPAQRPLNSRLNCDKLERDFGIRLASWEKQLEWVLED